MATQHIQIKPGASPYASDLLGLIRTLQSVVDTSRRLKATGDQIAFGGDWAALAAYLGTTAAEAEAVYNLLGSVTNTLTTDAFIAQLLARCG